MDREPLAAPDGGALQARMDAASCTPPTAAAKPRALAWALLAAALWPAAAWASWTLDFDVGGYCIEMEVGDDAGPKLGRVRFFPPGDATGIPLRPQDVRVKAFDPAHRRLRLEHRGAAPGAPPFDLIVEDDHGVLDLGTEEFRAPFDWQM